MQARGREAGYDALAGVRAPDQRVAALRESATIAVTTLAVIMFTLPLAAEPAALPWLGMFCAATLAAAGMCAFHALRLVTHPVTVHA